MFCGAGVLVKNTLCRSHAGSICRIRQGKVLVELFKILYTKPEDRDKYLAENNLKLAALPYVDGELFTDEK